MPDELAAPESAELNYLRAVNEALRWSLSEYPEAILFGEDVALPGGVFGAAKGLHEEFGDRVFDTPISESAIIGAAVGSAMRGMRPIVEIMYSDFFLVALDQVINQAANVRYTSRGKFTAPLTIRAQQGLTPGACAQHTQSLEALFCHIPGLRVCMPATPADAFELLRTAVATEDPTIVLEHRALYPKKAEVRLDGPLAPIGGGRVVRPGSDVTLVSWSRMVGDSTAAAELVASEGLDVEVIDLRWLAPLDFPLVAESVARTSRLVVAHEANLTGGFGAELAARVAQECFWNLEAPIERVALPDTRIPAAPSLQGHLLPDSEAIADALRRAAAP